MLFSRSLFKTPQKLPSQKLNGCNVLGHKESPTALWTCSRKWISTTKPVWAGHSKWHNIKHQKAAADIAKSSARQKVSREIITVTRLGGKDPSMNVRLTSAISKAKEVGLSKENIEYAIAKGAGETGATTEEQTLEGYGPGGVGLIIDVLTDSKTRATGFVRHTLAKNGGSLGTSGSVSRMFPQQGVVTLENASNKTEEELMEIGLEAGATDIQFGKGETGKEVHFTCDPKKLLLLKKELESKSLTIKSAQIVRIPTTFVTDLDDEQMETLNTLLTALEGSDDIQNVVHNFNPDTTAQE